MLSDHPSGLTCCARRIFITPYPMSNSSPKNTIVGKRLSAAILISIIVHFVLLVILGLWTVYQYVHDDGVEMSVSMEQQQPEDIPDEVVEPIEITEVSPQVEVDLERLLVDPIHAVELPQIPQVQMTPTPPTPTIPDSAINRIAFTPPTRTRIAWDQVATTEASDELLQMDIYYARSSTREEDVTRIFAAGVTEESLRPFQKVPQTLYLTHILHPRVDSLQEIFARLNIQLEPNRLVFYRVHGTIRPPESGEYRFMVASDERIGLAINGRLMTSQRTAYGGTDQVTFGARANRWGWLPTGWGRSAFNGTEWIRMDRNQTYRIDIIVESDQRGRYSAMVGVEKRGSENSERLTVFSVTEMPDEIDDGFGERIPPMNRPPALVFPRPR